MQKIKIYNILMLLLLAISCTKQTDMPIATEPTDTHIIRFDIGFAAQGTGGMQPRAATDKDFNTVWEDGDTIGIFAVSHPEGQTASLVASGNYIHNIKLTYNKVDNKWTSETPLSFPDDKDAQLDFYAYYPYDAAAIDPTTVAFKVQVDQSGNGFNASDLMGAAIKNVNKGSIVSLTFNHLLALVEVDISESSDNTPLYVANKLKVSLCGVKNRATLNLTANPVSASSSGITVQGILMHRVDMGDATKFVYRAFIPVQQNLPAGHKLFIFNQDLNGNGSYTDGNEFSLSYTLGAQTDLVSGNTLRYKIKLVETVILDHNHVYVIGDYYPHVGRVQGVVFSVNNGGKNGKIVSLDEGRYTWSSEKGLFGATSYSNGQVNTNAIKTYKQNNPTSAVTFPAFEWCMAKGNQWYLPAKDEIWELYNQKAAVNAALAGIHGATQFSEVPHWSSSEYNKFYAWFVSFSDGNMNYYIQKDEEALVRAVSAF